MSDSDEILFDDIYELHEVIGEDFYETFTTIDLMSLANIFANCKILALLLLLQVTSF